MPFRFRYLKPGGEEVAVEGLEELRSHIRSGALEEQTLLFDALTREWAPARAHAVWDLLSDPAAEDASDVRGGVAPPSDADGHPRPSDEGRPPASSGDEAEIVLLADPPDPVDARAFIEGMLKERAREGEPGAGVGVMRASPYSDVRSWAADTGSARDGAKGARPGSAASVEAAEPEDAVDASASAASARPIIPNYPLPPRRPPASRPRAPVLLGILGLGTLGAATLFFPGPGGGTPPGAEAAAAVAPGGGGVESPVRASGSGLLGELVATEAAAFDDMVEAMDSLRGAYQVAHVPPVWLEGRYLAGAEAYPEVAGYWLRYRHFVDEVRQRDTALFRQSLVGRLRARQVSGPMIPIRLAAALEDFEASQPERDTMYARMDDLARAALDLHELLRRNTDRIEYDPVTQTRASREPVFEAYTADQQLRQDMWSLLDRIFDDLARLHQDAPVARDSLGEQVLEGIRATAGR